MTYDDILCKAVSNLAGPSRRVVVRFRKPARRDASAMAHKSGGVYYIDLAPGRTEAAMLASLAHECAHVRLHGGDFIDLPDYAPNRFNPSPGALASPAIKKQEGEADRLASEWLEYAERKAGGYPGSWLDRRLSALAAWIPADIEAMINAAAIRGAAAAVKAALERR